MDRYIIDGTEVKEISYHQASIFVDACFFLAYIDLDDPRGDYVLTILDIWKEHEVKEVIISNHVASETIHNIFKNHIRETLSLTHKALRQRYQLTDDDMQIIGDYQTPSVYTTLFQRIS